MRFSKPELALEKVFEIEQALGIGFRVLSWRDLSANLFDAIQIERWVIFFVIFIIVAAAAFNLVCALIVSVVQRVSQLSLLRALGAQPMQLTALLALQGLGVGLMGSIIGLGLGVGAAYGFWALQDKLQLISGSVYRLDHIDIAFRYQDMIFILVATLCVCLIAVAAPARMAISQPIAKGLRYE
jgi:lipoprotein-releasing system permease protein